MLRLKKKILHLKGRFTEKGRRRRNSLFFTWPQWPGPGGPRRAPAPLLIQVPASVPKKAEVGDLTGVPGSRFQALGFRTNGWKSPAFLFAFQAEKKSWKIINEFVSDRNKSVRQYTHNFKKNQTNNKKKIQYLKIGRSQCWGRAG